MLLHGNIVTNWDYQYSNPRTAILFEVEFNYMYNAKQNSILEFKEHVYLYELPKIYGRILQHSPPGAPHQRARTSFLVPFPSMGSETSLQHLKQ